MYISTIGKEYLVYPKTDLVPVCPNCHSMLHKRKPAYSVQELKNIISVFPGPRVKITRQFDLPAVLPVGSSFF